MADILDTYRISSCGLVLAAAIWGFAFVIVKDSLDYIGVVWMVSIRFLLVAVCLSIIHLHCRPRWFVLVIAILTAEVLPGLLNGK